MGCVEYLKRHLPNAEFCLDCDRDALQNFLMALRLSNGTCVIVDSDCYEYYSVREYDYRYCNSTGRVVPQYDWRHRGTSDE
jgi:hypothetical protein